MLKKLFCFSFILLLLSITSTSFANVDIVAYYGMEEGSGNTVADTVGGNEGTTDGSPTWVDGPDGFGTALRFVGATSGVECGTFEPAVDGKVSIAFWAYFEGTAGAQYQGLICKAGAGQEFMTEVFGTSGGIYWNSTGTDDWGLTTLTAGQWMHIAIVHDNASATTAIYRDGVFQKNSTATWAANSPNDPVRIGSSWGTSNFFYGAIDEVYFFSSLLTAEEVVAVKNGEMTPESNTAGLAKKPIPGNKEEGVSVNVGTLSWTPGDYVAAQNGTHNVYFGTDVNNVTNATLSDAEQLGVTLYAGLDSNSVDIAKLEYDTTYYWRVDEVNIPSKPGIATGKIWNFATEPKGVELTAKNVVGVEFNSPYEVYDFQEPNTTYNGVGLDDVNGTHSNDNTTMWIGMGDGPGDVWLQYELDQIYKLHQLKIWNYNEAEPSLSFGAMDVNVLYSVDNVTWKALDEIQVFPMATGESTYKADIFVDMNGAIAKYVKLSFLSSYSDGMYTGGISEIRFLVIPTRASIPSPANNATNVSVSSILSWKAGRDVAVHKIYIDSDKDSVINGNADIKAETTVPNYAMALELNQTYYWRVDEVNVADEYPTWDGPVWQFSTPQSILIDGFETGYGNDTNTNAVFKTWKDGAELSDSSNGSWMGRKSEPYLQTINHSGGHSAPMAYDNQSYSYSEVKAETSKLAIGPDWSRGNPGALVIWFMSDANDINEPATDRLYVKIGSTRKVYTGPASDIRRTSWTKWEVPLAGISLGNVDSITIGVEKIGSAGGIGTLYLDDIMLTPASPLPPAAVNPGTTGLLAKYAMENNVQDTSGNGRNGTLVGTANGGLTYVDGLSGYGKALVFDGNDDCVDLGKLEAFNFEGSFSISIWAKANAWSTNWGNVMIGNRGEDSIGWQIRRYTNNTVCFTTRGVGTSQDDTNTNFNVAIREWNNITCVYDAEAYTKSIYINGVLDKTLALTGTVKKVTATTHNTYIGARANAANTGKDALFKGTLDQILIYNRALSASEAAFLGDPTP